MHATVRVTLLDSGQYVVIFVCSRIPDSIGKDIEKKCQSIYPLHDVCIRKVKVLKKPKFDSEFFGIWNDLPTTVGSNVFSIMYSILPLAVGKLMDMHGEGVGAKVDGTYEPPIQDSV